MLRIDHPRGRTTDYSHSQLTREARHAAKHAPDGDGKLRGWYVRIAEGAPAGSIVCLCVDYLTRDGQPRTTHVAI